MDRIIIGNWKMHKTGREAAAFVRALVPQLSTKVRVMLAPSFPAIAPAALAAEGTSILIGAQNMHEAEHGAFTGEVSAEMLKDAGARFVILGHSERRRLFYETDNMICRKIHRAFSAGLLPVLCVGETQEERDFQKTAAVLSRQIEEALKGAPEAPFILAYEPVWAIGTGKTATPEMAEEAHLQCRAILSGLWGAKAASAIPIIYGGSVTGETAPALFQQPTIGGALVGGASLQIPHFHSIIQGAHS